MCVYVQVCVCVHACACVRSSVHERANVCANFTQKNDRWVKKTNKQQQQNSNTALLRFAPIIQYSGGGVKLKNVYSTPN